MVKVHILGGSGSGKTTVAQAIASRLDIPHYDLDSLGQRNGTNDAAWIADIERITGQPAWVTEGIYAILIDQLLYDADHVILLDIPWPMAAWQILRRHIIHSVRGANRYPGLQSLVALLRYARTYYANTDDASEETIRHYVATHPPMMRVPTTETLLADLHTFPTLVIPPTAAFVRQYLAPYDAKLTVVRTANERSQLLQRLYNLEM